MATSPTQLSLRYLREIGYLPEVVERFNIYSKTRKDLFGFGDIIAVRPGSVLLVQTTTKANQAARVKKIKECDTFDVVLMSGIVVVVHGWSKVRGRWQVTVTEVTRERSK